MNLKDIETVVNNAIKDANAVPLEETREWCVNWGDLRCVDVRRWESMDGDTGIEVLVEEADPSNWEFSRYVTNYVFERLGVVVDVRTEW